MGRTRKPIAELTRDMTVEYQQRREYEQQAAELGALPENPPSTLVKVEARQIWAWAVGQMKEKPLIGSADVLNLEGMCNAFAMYREVTKQLNEQPVVVTVGGKPFLNPLVNAQKKYAEEYRAFARLCGFTVDSRLKLAAVSVKEIDDEITETFGDI